MSVDEITEEEITKDDSAFLDAACDLVVKAQESGDERLLAIARLAISELRKDEQLMATLLLQRKVAIEQSEDKGREYMGLEEESDGPMFR